ncbi:hypothetical protein ANN_00838 [Periplaneta americana]|uniref:DUF659 domain-containing protein n=1 Tax=Periplaneta americana TaxID=6978 RepID=A0ABQ8TRW3_PERAM|nr:hypothetical protein ANN_00838 [Periplaneta americana]
MPKVRHSVNLKSKLTSYISEFKEDGLSTDNKILFCNLCQCAVSSTQKFLVQQHITTSKHQANKQLNSKQRQLFLTQPTTSNVRSEFNIDLCRSLISADIPLYKLKNKVFREFLEKYTQHTIPDESTLRKTYAPSIYDETIQKIRDEIKDSSIWVSIDETPDKEGRLVGNVVIGLLSEQYSERILLHCDVLEKCNNKTIVKLFNEAMGILWPKGIMYDNVLFFISDAAPYMVKAGQALSVVYPKLTHFTCVAHAFHPPSRVNVLKEMYPEIPLPPKPILTRWGTWLEAVEYYAEHIDSINNVLLALDSEDAVSIDTAKTVTCDISVKNDLAHIQHTFSCIIKTLKSLQNRHLSLSESFEIINSTVEQLNRGRVHINPFPDDQIEEAFRIGRGKNHPILVKFTSMCTKLFILDHLNMLKGTNLKIEQDYSVETRSKRKMLLPFMKEARSRGQFAILVKDKMKINGKLYDLEYCQRNFKSQKSQVSERRNFPTREKNSSIHISSPTRMNTEQPEEILDELVRDGEERSSQQTEVWMELKQTSETRQLIDERDDRAGPSQESAEPSGTVDRVGNCSDIWSSLRESVKKKKKKKKKKKTRSLIKRVLREIKRRCGIFIVATNPCISKPYDLHLAFIPFPLEVGGGELILSKLDQVFDLEYSFQVNSNVLATLLQVEELNTLNKVAFMPYRVNGQYIMEGLASSFLFTMGGLGFVVLDHTHSPSTPKLNRILLISVGFLCILVSFFTCWIFMRMKLPIKIYTGVRIGTLSTMENLQQILQAIAEMKAEMKNDIREVKSEMKDDMNKHISELKKDISEVKTEMKSDISEVKTEMKSDISEVKTEMKSDISEVKGDISGVKGDISGVKDDVTTQIESISAHVDGIVAIVTDELKADLDKLNQNFTTINETVAELRQDVDHFDGKIRALERRQEETSVLMDQYAVENKHILALVDRQAREQKQIIAEEVQLAVERSTTELRTSCSGLVEPSPSARHCNVKPPKFDGTISWAIFRRQFEAIAEHNGWTLAEKTTRLLAALQGQASEILHSVPEDGAATEIMAALEGRYGDHQLAAAFRTQLNTRVQQSGESLQEFAMAVEQLAHKALRDLPPNFVAGEAAYTFGSGVRDPEIRQQLLLAEHRTINAALAAALRRQPN